MKPTNRVVITLCGSSNTGKTTTLKNVIDKLERKYKVNDVEGEFFVANDRLVTVDIDGVKVGISTGGDRGKGVKDCITKLLNKGCNIIITATRSKGATVKVVNTFCENNKYKLDRIKKSLTIKQKMNKEECNKRNKKYNKIDSEIVFDAIFHHFE